MADTIVDPSAPPPLVSAPAVTPPATPPVSPPVSDAAVPSKEPEKPKTAYVTLEPQETPNADTTPDAKPIVAAKPTDPPGKDQIVSAGVLTVVMVKTTGSPRVHRFNGVKLPKNAADLSVVEVHRDPTSTGPDVAVFPNKDEAIGSLPANDGTNKSSTSVGVGALKSVSFRKMSKALWAVIS